MSLARLHCVNLLIMCSCVCVCPQPPLVQAVFNRNADEVQLYLHKKDEVNALVGLGFSFPPLGCGMVPNTLPLILYNTDCVCV